MYTRRGAGHEEYITGGVQDMRNVYLHFKTTLLDVLNCTQVLDIY